MRNVFVFSSILVISAFSVIGLPVPNVSTTLSDIATPVPELSGDEKISLLTKGSWQIQSILSDKPCDTDGDGKMTRDIASEMPACGLDDIMSVHGDGKIVFERFERCALEEQAVETYQWKLNRNQFVIHRAGIETEMIFKTVTPDELVLVIPSEALGEMYYFTVTYGRPMRN